MIAGGAGTCRTGFTVVELLVALSVGAIALFGATALYVALIRAPEGLERLASREVRLANADRVLRQLTASTEMRTEAGGPFVGTARVARFSTWCDNPGGWKEPCLAELSIHQNDSGLVVSAQLPHQRAVVLANGRNVARFVYLADPSHGGHWRATWTDSASAPLALGIITDADTVIARVRMYR